MSAAKSGLKAPTRVVKNSPSPLSKSKSPSTSSGPAESSDRPVDDFIIGDRVFVGGTKPGHIAYLGETQFAGGEWAGVVLDEPVGKNDGAVNGIRYFQCEPMKGVFARISKLRHERCEMASPSPSLPSPSGTKPPPTAKSARVMRKSVSQTERMSSPHGSMSNLIAGDGIQEHGKVRVGDRVIVSGTKRGVLRYIGLTEFARGDWAGVELDEPLGKNDGSVAGKRYFACKPLYGLFAPIHKVNRLSGGDASTPIRASMMENRIALGLRRESTGSQDSISSIGSSASSLSRSRVRLGVTSLNSPKKTAQRPSKLTGSTSIAGLQKALQEKEDHIEQLLKERDMERSEVARAAAQVDEAEGKLIALKTEHERYLTDNDENMGKLKSLVQQLEIEKIEVATLLEEEKRKVEDYEFRMEEEEINKEDIEEKSGADSARMAVIEKALELERVKVRSLEEKVDLLKPLYDRTKAELKEAEESATAHLDRIEELSHNLNTAQDKLNILEDGSQTDASQIQSLIVEKDARIRQLERNLNKVDEELTSVKSSLNESKENATNLEGKIGEQDSALQSLKQKYRQSEEERQKVESEKRQIESKLTESNRNSCDSSNQFSQKIEELKVKLETAESENSNATQKLENLEMEYRKLTRLLPEKDEALKKLEASLKSRDDELSATKATLDSLQANVGNFKIKCKEQDSTVNNLQSKLKMSEEKFDHLTSVKTKLENELLDLMKNSGDSTSQYMGKIEEMTRTLSDAESKIQSLEEAKRSYSLEVKQMTDSMNEKDAMIKGLETSVEEKDKVIMSSSLQLTDVNDNASKLESERRVLTAELDDLKAKLSNGQQTTEKVAGEKKRLEDEIAKLTKNSGETASQSQSRITNLEHQLSGMQDKYKLLEVQNRNLSSDLDEVRSESVEKKNEVKQLREMVEAKSTECTSLITDLQASRDQVDVIRQEFCDLKKSMSGNASQLNDSRTQCQSLRTQVESLKSNLNDTHQKCQEKESALSQALDQLTEFKSECQKLRTARQDLETNLANMNESTGSSSVQLALLESKLRDRDVEQENMQSLLAGFVKKLASVYDNLGMECGNSIGMVSLLAADKGVPKQQMEDVVHGLEAQVQEAKNLLKERKALQNRLNEVESKQNGHESLSSEEKQVDFLNTVIVDLQKKNSELQAKLDVMETGSIFGGSNHSHSSSPVPRKGNAPRLFCDICEEFDVHDTEDCPRQTMSDCDYHQNSSRTPSVPRPYCDICEMFGHTTESCNDDQTF